MADPEPRGAEAREAQSRTSKPAGRDNRSPEAMAESRVFEQSAEMARRATEAGAETARDFARAGAESGRRIAETGSRVIDRGADLWRQSMFPLTSLSYEMNRLFDEFWRSAVPGMAGPSMSAMGGPGASLMQGLMGLPSADLHETPDAYHIVIELAGMRPEEVEVFVDGDALVVRGEKRDSHREERGGFRVNERRFGHFERRFHLPRDANREDIDAEIRHGLLEIRAGRRASDEESRKRIEVRDGGGERRGREEGAGRAGQRGQGGGAGQPRT
jgi:HSP20 family protein